ncbi:hypothetical protein ACKLNR_014667 [Fusarium oxysporum f. sp. zingiberi]
MYETVETSTRFHTLFADSSHPSSPSVAGETQSADTPYQPSTEGKETGTRPKAHTPTESISDVTSSAVSKATAPPSIDEEGNLAITSKTWHSDVSTTTAAGQSEDVHEMPSTISDDAQQETVPSYATMDDEVTRTPAQSHVPSTSAGAEATRVNEKEQKPESATEASSVPSFISGATQSEMVPSSKVSTTTTTTLTQTDDSHTIKTEISSGTSFKEECTESSKERSAQESSGGGLTRTNWIDRNFRGHYYNRKHVNTNKVRGSGYSIWPDHPVIGYGVGEDDDRGYHLIKYWFGGPNRQTNHNFVNRNKNNVGNFCIKDNFGAHNHYEFIQ